jgi:plasmid stability protein
MPETHKSTEEEARGKMKEGMSGEGARTRQTRHKALDKSYIIKVSPTQLNRKVHTVPLHLLSRVKP